MLARFGRVLSVAYRTYPVGKSLVRATPFIEAQKRWGGGHGHGPVTPLDSAIHFLDREDVTKRVLKIVAAFDKVTKEVKADSHFVNDLGLDSLDVVEVVMSLEQEFNVDMSNQDAEKIHTVKDAIDYFCAHPASM
uniref:NDUFAB1-alpha n=1 Tax=Euglena gracilis TaxID=3039 RepID=UPI002FE4FB72